MKPGPEPGVGERITFLQLFRRHPRVEIPVIQRDYAHGRSAAAEVRREFLDAIFDTLVKEPAKLGQPLDLDFVYGSNDQNAPDSFLPLDGQQRLTTLFLLHWYLAWTGGATDDFTDDFTIDTKQGRQSKFTYAVRASSKEFFDGLVNFFPARNPVEGQTFSAMIRDQSWCFRSWELDPTVTSALGMLDALHKKFAGKADFYARLTRDSNPYITFQLLDLRRFDLSDDLYIKMNARGVPLTPFESFKARLEKSLKDLCAKESSLLGMRKPPVPEYFSHRIDTAWADLFWHYREKNKVGELKIELFDRQVMNLIRTLIIVTRDPEAKGVDKTLEMLRDPKLSFSFFKYQDEGCIDERFATTLIAVLDRWCGAGGGIRTYLSKDGPYDEAVGFKDAIHNTGDSMTYPELIRFHAYCAYLTSRGGEIDPARLGAWVRVIGNLAVNTVYRTVARFRRSLRAVNELLPHADRILERLTEDGGRIGSFVQQQVREERIKAALIRKGSAWTELILDAERHPYFQGQIEFLLKFAGVLDRWLAQGSCEWSDEDDAEYRRGFTEYFAKAAAVFGGGGLSAALGERRWERALLSEGDYLLTLNSNWSFLDNTTGRASWKRLLRGSMKAEGVEADDAEADEMEADGLAETKRGYVKKLLEKIDLTTGVGPSLDKVIADAKPDVEWRRLCVERPELMEFCWKGQTRWPDDNEARAFLLRGQRMSGEHAELFTYYLHVAQLPEMLASGALQPFHKCGYHPVNTDSAEPFVFLEDRTGSLTLEIRNTRNQLEFKLFRRGIDLPDMVKARILTNPAFVLKGDSLVGQVAWEAIDVALREIATDLRSID